MEACDDLRLLEATIDSFDWPRRSCDGRRRSCDGRRTSCDGRRTTDTHRHVIGCYIYLVTSWTCHGPVMDLLWTCHGRLKDVLWTCHGLAMDGVMDVSWMYHGRIRLETKSSRILPLTHVTKYDPT